jgi:LysR family transcriptional regulator, glycine cleavage system transcriptional activator
VSIPLARLTNLDLLRGFVAVGRHMSITLAAQELNLSQSAVSKQVIGLEERTGMKLLVRGHRSVSLTPAGDQLFRVANQALLQLQGVLGELQVDRSKQPVRLTASVGVAGLWLLPRLKGLQRLHPGIDLRVLADNRVLDLRQEGIDLAIRYAAPAQVEAGATRLFGSTIAPVAHPSLGARGLRVIEDFAQFTLLEYDDKTYAWLRWSNWFASTGLRHDRPQGVQHFNQYDQVIQAAASGQGIAMGRLELMREWLADGRLEQAAPALARDAPGHCYWLLRSDERPREQVRLVASWIESKAHETSAFIDPPAWLPAAGRTAASSR